MLGRGLCDEHFRRGPGCWFFCLLLSFFWSLLFFFFFDLPLSEMAGSM